MESYLIASTIAFWMLTIIWSKNDIFNVCIKIGFCGLAIMGTIFSLQALGFIIRGGL